MAVVSKAALKNYFLSGKVPVQSNYEDLIDSLFGGAEYIDIKDISVPGTPSSGYGRLYINGDTLQLKDDIGAIAHLSTTKQYLRGPVDPYLTNLRSFAQNDFVNGIAEFNDSQASPYSFGGSPGGFSLSLGSGAVASSNGFRHHLSFYQGFSATPSYLQWASATAIGPIYYFMGLRSYYNPSDTLAYSIRAWGVQSPGASDMYFEARFKFSTTGLQFALFYGTGTTFSLTDGTLVGSWQMLPAASRYRCYRHYIAAGSGTNGMGIFDLWDKETHTIEAQLAVEVVSPAPRLIRCARFQLAPSTGAGAQIDRISTVWEGPGTF